MRSYDGLKDSLTDLASPPLLFEALKRELARAERRGEVISLVRFLLVAPEESAADVAKVKTSESINDTYQREILLFGRSLSSLTRGEDLCARMGHVEFLCSLNVNHFRVDEFVRRIFIDWQRDVKHDQEDSPQCELELHYSSLASSTQESVLDFLNRLDGEELIPIFVI
jgi:GGDEF domain-containing protein